MTIPFNRRRLLKAVAGTAVVGAGATVFGNAPADAAAPSIGTIVIPRMWGTMSVRQRILGTKRFRYVRVPRSKKVYEGTTTRILNLGGLCHWYGTAGLLENGNCVMFGHRTSHGGPLRKADKMRVGDPIVVTVGTTSVTYFVSEETSVIAGSDAAAVYAWGSDAVPGITLVACSRPDKRPTSTKFRILVRAQAVSG